MKTPLSLLAAFLLAAQAAHTQELSSGKVLVLDNDRTLEGDIDRLDNQYRVRRSAGITWVPTEKVLKLCRDKADALAFLRTRANLQDPDERLRLARWCHLQGLRDEALTEVKAAVELRADHAESQRLLRYLSQSVRHAPQATASATPAPKTPYKEPPAITITGDSLGQFATRIQPILMNACARCHAATGHEGAFRLERSSGQGLASRRSLQVNLAAVLAQLHSKQPERSPLLVKAMSAHGPTSEAPLKGRQAEAFAVMEDWVRATLANNPHLQDAIAAAPTPVQKPTPPPPPPPPGKEEKPATPETPAGVRDIPPLIEQEEPESEYDPLPFNRQMHPERFKKKEG